MSQSSVALEYQVTPLFDGITYALDDHAKDPKNKPAVHMAAVQGRIMLDKYYGLMDDSVVYQIAMCRSCQLSLSCCQLTQLLVLHPCYKSSYFQKAGWPRDWVHTAEDLLHQEYDKNYKLEASEMPENTSTVVRATFIQLIFCQNLPTKNKYFEEFDFNASSSAHPVDEWLNSPPIAGADGLQYWGAMAGH
jgi:hypothetical protein